MEEKENNNKFLDILLVAAFIISICGLLWSTYQPKNSASVNQNRERTVQYNNNNSRNFNQNERPAKYYIDLAKDEFDKKKYEKALDYWYQSLDAHPYHPEGVYHDIGMTYVVLNRYSEAIEPLKKSIELGGNYNSTYYYLGEAYYYSNQTETAKEYYEKAVSMRDGSGNNQVIPYAYRKLAIIERQNGNSKKAQEYELQAQNY